MKKTFNTIAKGDKVYIATIKNSKLITDCVGNMIMEHYVSYIMNIADFYTLELVLEDMKPECFGKFKKDENPKERYAYVNRNSSLYIENLKPENINDYGLNINKRIIATTKKELCEKLIEIGENFKNEVKNLKEILSDATLKQESYSINVDLLMKCIEAEKNTNLSLEEAASMAM